MADLAQLEERILSALGRIGAGIDHWPTATGTSPDGSTEIARLQRQVDESSLENQHLHTAVAQLRQDLHLMEEQAEAHLSQASLAAQSLQAELDALTQAREAETAEIAKILAALAPLVDAAETAPHA